MDQLRAMRVFARVIDEGSFAAGGARARPLAGGRDAARRRPRGAPRRAPDQPHHAAPGADRHRRGLPRARAPDPDRGRRSRGARQPRRAEPRGHLRVLAPPAFAVHQLAKHLPRFRAQYPQVSLELAGAGAVETVDENYDVTILIEGRQAARRQLHRAPAGALRGDHLRLARVPRPARPAAASERAGAARGADAALRPARG